MSLFDAAQSGVELTALEALRDDLALKLDDCDSLRDYAALSLRLLDTLRRLSELQPGVPVERSSVLDELAKRRSARGAGTAI